MRYDKVWATLSKRAVKQAGIDAETFMEMAANANLPVAEVQRRLLADLENNGPIFGKFVRSLSGAASSSVLTAERQGGIAATVDGSEELRRLLDLETTGLAMDDADPDALDTIEQATKDQEYTWVATLVNTCDRCLPLHGKSMTMLEWESAGDLPETIHDGWDSDCQCDLIPTGEVDDNLSAPIVRARVRGADGKITGKRTQRAIASSDIDRAKAAVAKAIETKNGRLVLRQLGQVNSEDE